MITTTKYLPSEMAAAIDAIPIFSNITAEDNGMVVVNGRLQDQTTRTIVANGTYDTTTNDEVQVNVSGSGNVTLVEKSVTDNGTYLPSGDSADGYSKVTVNVPTVSAADNGKAVSGGRLVEQTTKSISANGTYNTTLNNSVIVNVPNSGSGSSIVTYDVPDFIENTDKSKVLLDLYADDYDETNQSWGDMVLETSTDTFFNKYGSLKLDSQGLEVGGKYSYRFDIQDASKITIYAVAKRRRLIPASSPDIITVDFGYVHMGNTYYEGRPYSVACIDSQGPYAEKPIGKFNVYTLTVDMDNLSTSFYANGAFVSSKELNSNARLRYVKFGQNADAQFLYVGVVDGIEDTQTIFANQRIATTFIQNARMILPDDDMPSPMFLNDSESDDILVNADYRDFNSSDNTFGPLVAHGGVLTDDCEGVLVSDGVALTYALPTSVGGLTVYAVVKNVYGTDRVAGTYNELDTILFQLGSTSGNVEGVYLHGKTGSTGTYPETNSRVFDLFPVEDFGVYVISVNYATNKANFYFEGSLKATVDISDGPYNVLTFGGKYVSGEISDEACVQLLFAGVVSGVEDSTVIAQNSIELREFMNDSRIALGTEAKSIVSKTITENGTYNPVSDGAYAYSQVIVDVQQHTEMPSGGVIPTFLESSNQNNIVESIDYTDFDSENGTWGDFTVATREDVVGELSEDCRGVVINKNISLVHAVPSTNGGVTIYAIVSVRDSGPILDTKESQVEVIARKSEISLYTAESANESYGIDVPVGLFNVIAVSINYSTLAVEFYVNGVLVHTGRTLYVPTKIYFGGNVYSDTGYISTANPTDINCLYFGMVSGVESQNVIVNNMSVMQSFVAHSRIFLQDSTPSIPTFLSHSVQSSVLANSNYYDFLNGLDGFSLVSGNLSHGYFGTRIDENTAVSCDVSGTSEGLTIYLIARAYNAGKTKVTFDSTHIMYGPAFVLSLMDASDNSSLFNVRIGDSAAIYYADGHDNTTTQNVYGTPFLTFNAYAITVSYNTGVVTLYMNEINPNPPTLTIGQVSAGRLILGGEYEDVWSNEPSYSHTFKSDGQLLHCGVVNGVESSGTIGQNLADMVSFLQNARFKVPTEVSLVAKTITANGTYDPEDDNADGYSEVNVNLPLLRRKSYIPYTDQTRILQELTWADYDTENHTFGAFTLFGSSYPTVDANGLLLGENTYLAYDLVNVKRDITVYVVCKRHSSLSGDRYIFGCPVTGTFGEVEEEAVPAFTVDGADVNCVTTLINHVYNYRSDSPIYSGDDYIVLSMQIRRGESSSVAYFSYGSRSWQGEFRHDAHLRYFYLGGDGKTTSGGTTTNSDYYFLYVAIVDGIDDITGQSSYGAGTLNEDFLYNSINELKTAPHMSLTTKTITANGTFDALNDNADGYSQVTVNVPSGSANLQTLTVTSNGVKVPSEGYDGFSKVFVKKFPNLNRLTGASDLYSTQAPWTDYDPDTNKWRTSTYLVNVYGTPTLGPVGVNLGGDSWLSRANGSQVTEDMTAFIIFKINSYEQDTNYILLAVADSSHQSSYPCIVFRNGELYAYSSNPGAASLDSSKRLPHDLGGSSTAAGNSSNDSYSYYSALAVSVSSSTFVATTTVFNGDADCISQNISGHGSSFYIGAGYDGERSLDCTVYYLGFVGGAQTFAKSSLRSTSDIGYRNMLDVEALARIARGGYTL